jgi:hypothetical protein
MNAITSNEADFAFHHAAFHELEPSVPDAARYDGKSQRCGTPPH